jgi:autotransporter adhesin
MATAVGQSAQATATGATAIGQGSIASGTGAFAGGIGATASGVSAVALGAGATAAFAGSTAIGPGAVTTAPNQMVFGTASNTYVAPGITSAASLAAQSGPTSFVTTDAAGHLAASSFSPSMIMNNLASLNQSVGSLQSQINGVTTEERRGIAAAVAANSYTTPVRAGGTTVGISGGFFHGESAVGLSVAHRLYALPQAVLYGSYANSAGAENVYKVGASYEF